jgi:Tol biopolymer transport system component
MFRLNNPPPATLTRYNEAIMPILRDTFMRLLPALLLACLLISTVHAQDAPTPLAAPLIASSSAALDRILLYDLNGGRRELRFDNRLHYAFGFSPDGCRLIYTLSERGGVSRLYSARLDGSDARALVGFADLPAADWSVWEPAVNPADGRIAFTLFRRERPPTQEPVETFHVAWIPPEGGAPQLYSVSGAEHTPLWSPDGRWLAYVAYDGRIPGPDIFSTIPPTNAANSTPVPDDEMLNEADLWVVSADGATKYRLTAFPVGSVTAPRWSPGSDLLGFIFSPTFANDTLWLIGNADAAVPTQLSFEWMLAVELTWLPDGSAMLATLRDFQGSSENRLWRIPLIGNADSDATPYPLDPALRFIDYPRFSPDGHWLALRSEYEIVVVDTQTGGWRYLDEAHAANTPPVWSPAGFAGEAACGG